MTAQGIKGFKDYTFYAKLRLVKESDNELLSSEKLIPYGFPDKFPQRGMKNIPSELLTRIESIFNNEAHQDKEQHLQFQAINMILYGPPGTGKTYNTIDKALKIVIPDDYISMNYKDDHDKAVKRFNELLFQPKKNQDDNKIGTDENGEQLWLGRIAFTTFHQSYGYEEFIEGIKPVEESNQILYKTTDGIFKRFCEHARKSYAETDENGKPKRYVFIIDEINRGNISKIFGELITLIEPNKREREREVLPVVLPYSVKPFTVPNNVDIIGTMNTADRSLVQIDTALRRRFDFIEMMPQYDILKVVKFDGVDIDIPKMLEAINQRIECLYDREHMIGHSYFMDLNENSSIEDLNWIFKSRIVPLLQEYFFDDYDKIKAILNDKADDCYFISQKKAADETFIKGFLESDDISDEKHIYSINDKAPDAKAYINIYTIGIKDKNDQAQANESTGLGDQTKQDK